MYIFRWNRDDCNASEIRTICDWPTYGNAQHPLFGEIPHLELFASSHYITVTNLHLEFSMFYLVIASILELMQATRARTPLSTVH